jgi:hypothetical protein
MSGGVKAAFSAAALLAILALLASGCGSSSAKTAATTPVAPAKPHCAYPAGWVALANRIHAAVYCPGWLPDPLTSQLKGAWNNINSVSPDRSYLESFVWQDTEGGGTSGELHVNLRGYPGRTKIPGCTTGGVDSQNVPCFADPTGTVVENGIKATLFTVNQDADQWHLLLAWRHAGGLYTVSEHLAPPLDYSHLVRYLKHELRDLVLIKPSPQT